MFVLALNESLLIIFRLTCGCTLLICGSVSDVVGPRRIYILGCLLLTGTTLGCGLARTGIEFILFRAVQGIALSLCLPSAVQLITGHIPPGSRRNIAFASLGAGQPVGFALGLVLGGVFIRSIGWRWGYYIAAIIVFLIFLTSMVGLPNDKTNYRVDTLRRLHKEVDWIGCIVISVSLGMNFSICRSLMKLVSGTEIATIYPDMKVLTHTMQVSFLMFSVFLLAEPIISSDHYLWFCSSFQPYSYQPSSSTFGPKNHTTVCNFCPTNMLINNTLYKQQTELTTQTSTLSLMT
jgi:MFS family permease